MSEIKKNSIDDEWMDKELQGVGVRFTDMTQNQEETEIPVADYDQAEDEYLEAKATVGKAGKVLANLGSLVAADALLMFMCMADKIELAYGLVFLAAASAFFGARVNNARI